MRESSIDRWAAKVGCGRCVLGVLGGQRGSVTRDPDIHLTLPRKPFFFGLHHAT